MAVEKVKELSVGIGDGGEEGKRKMLERCASTALNSKLISQHQDFFAPMVVDAISSLDEMLDIKMVGVKKVPGGSVTDSFLVNGVAFKKTFSYAGFEQQPKVILVFERNETKRNLKFNPICVSEILQS